MMDRRAFLSSNIAFASALAITPRSLFAATATATAAPPKEASGFRYLILNNFGRRGHGVVIAPPLSHWIADTPTGLIIFTYPNEEFTEICLQQEERIISSTLNTSDENKGSAIFYKGDGERRHMTDVIMKSVEYDKVAVRRLEINGRWLP